MTRKSDMIHPAYLNSVSDVILCEDNRQIDSQEIFNLWLFDTHAVDWSAYLNPLKTKRICFM
jgi:hypothetical protein